MTIDQKKFGELQARVDAILNGTAQPKPGTLRKPEDERLFAPYHSEDAARASAGAALFRKIADRAGIEAAIEKMEDSVGQFPYGQLERSIMLFLAHQPGPPYLQMRSLEERQPGMFKPSKPANPAP